MENHLFISYAHLDNLKTPVMAGWVTRFHKTLVAYLSTNIGEEAKIWRDDKLGGGDKFNKKIARQLPITVALISVLSERYFKSASCMKEITEFCRIAEENPPPGLIVGDKVRVFKVMLMPISEQQHERLHPSLKDTLGFPFYEKIDGQTILLLDPAFGKDYGEAYHRQIFSLSREVAELVDLIQENNGVDPGLDADPVPLPKEPSTPSRSTNEPDPPVPSTEATDKPVIYLAECGWDRQNDREWILEDLKEHGYTILPKQQLPALETDYIQEVEQILGTCDLAIHLIGQGDGGRPSGPSRKSKTALQNELAVKQSRDGALHRVIWLPEGTKSDDTDHQAFIDALHRKPEVQFQADLITGNRAQLKEVIHATLKKLETPAKPEIEHAAEPVRQMIYLICDEQERIDPNLIDLVRFLREHFIVKLPVFAGNTITEVREANEILMKSCDAVILYYGIGPETWKLSMERELMKMGAYRNTHPLLATFTYLVKPVTDDKKFLILSKEPNLIDGLEGFSAEKMEAFMKAVNA